MGQPSLPPPPLAPPPPLPGGDGFQVCCSRCMTIHTVGKGLLEFVCPNCQFKHTLPPELLLQMTLAVDPLKIQLPCSQCNSILTVPHGISRFTCPQCGADLAVDLSRQLNPTLPGAPLPPPPPEEVNEVAIEVEREEDEGGLAGETFMDYRPPKLSIGLPHPDPIVETSSLSAVQPPEPTYDLKIKDDLESSNALSCLQIEAVIYACQRHLQHLSDNVRAGFFIGDGAGVGKGRTIAGLIWENWHHKRRKALWVSIGSDLKFDARRDLDDVGAKCVGVQALNKLPYTKIDAKANGFKEGVLFLTYSSLIASSDRGRSRLQQLVQWCGTDFDGLIIFDECHKAKNLVPEAKGKPTRTGEAVLEIQEKLPQARVVYCSATGASEPRNMGYMVRLGLWGDGTSFEDFQTFLDSMQKGGVGALELVAMDMKARGMYVCRTLSYKGAEFEVVDVPLEPNMMDIYTKAANFWTDLMKDLQTALDKVPAEKPSMVWKMYWANHQRFFKYLCMSAKIPAIVRLAKQALLEDKCVVIGLQSTGEARTEEAVSKHGPEFDDFISGPRELLLKYIGEHYPLPEKPEPLPEENVINRKRHSETPEESIRGRGRGRGNKVAKLEDSSDKESSEESESKGSYAESSEESSESKESDDEYEESESESEAESSDSDDEFAFCTICNSDEEKKKLLKCSKCEKLIHPICLSPPVLEEILGDWLCPSCDETTNKHVQDRRVHIAEQLKRHEKALNRKSELLEIISSLDLPNNPLDDIIDQLGGPGKVAEITGRKGMLVRVPGGKGVKYQARNSKDVSMEMVNMNEKKLFMEGKKLIAIISEAGSAGVSLQADRRALNQKRRVHLTLELPWSADRAIQQFGRTHRSNQASAPQYRLLFTNLGGERRFASIVAKRLESLGALTQGDRRAGPSLSAYNYDTTHGKRALNVLYTGIMAESGFPVTPPGCSSEDPDTIQDFIVEAKDALFSVGIIKEMVPGSGIDSGYITDSVTNDVGRFLNRLLGLEPNIQNRLFELFVSILDIIIANARNEGRLDSGIVEIRANTITLQGDPKIVHVDDVSGASTVLFTFTLDRGLMWESACAKFEDKEKDGNLSSNDGFYESKREWLGTRHYVLAFEGSAPRMFKILRPTVGESLREMPLEELKGKYRKVTSKAKARRGWEHEYKISSERCMHGPNCKLGSYCTVGRSLQEVNVLGGLILPVWGTIEEALSKQARPGHRRIRIVNIVTTLDNQRTVGLYIPNAAVKSVLKRFN